MQQTTVIAGAPLDPTSQQIADLRAQASAMKLRSMDLDARKSQLTQQKSRLAADVDPSAIDKQLSDVQHELNSTYVQLESMNQQIHDLQEARDMARLGITVQPPMPPMSPEPLIGREQLAMGGTAVFLLLVPIVLAYSRRIWRRAVREQPANVDDSQRLVRMEQAIESIAVEVERIGEAQRFTTKLFADRAPDAVARMAALPRREPGTITPH
jgi:hypothetical protein